MRKSWFRRANRKVRLSSVELPAISLGQHGRTLGRVGLCALLGLAMVGGGVGVRHILLHSPKFALEAVRFPSLRHLDEQKLFADTGFQLGTSLFALDLTRAEATLAKEPWVASVKLRRQLPHTVAVDLVEREPSVAVALGSIYLADGKGDLFKRARADEQIGVPVVTGIARERYSADPIAARAVLRRAIELAELWRAGGRPELGELHHDGGRDAAAMFTAYFTHAGKPVAVRLGSADGTTPDRLRRLDAVLAALDETHQRASVIHLDQRVQLDRIAVRLWRDEPTGTASEDAAPQRETETL